MTLGLSRIPSQLNPSRTAITAVAPEQLPGKATDRQMPTSVAPTLDFAALLKSEDKPQ